METYTRDALRDIIHYCKENGYVKTYFGRIRPIPEINSGKIKIIKNLVDTDSSMAVLAHNHPTSSAEPSAYDVDSTRMVCVTLRKIGYLK